MPAKAPRTAQAEATQLGLLGQHIRQRRKALRVSATVAAQAAGMSRVTLHRIERGEASVTMGAYLNAMAALGLGIDVVALSQPQIEPEQRVSSRRSDNPQPGARLPPAVHLADTPQLKRLAWHLPGVTEITPTEAFSLYERNWRHLDADRMSPHERELLGTLVRVLGNGHLLV